ncbi:MAG UNVERIFIED_CONTAM: 50S ribosomal protein L20 [Planctomycetaceae bacterium]|jgi:large subunit ribosomal protein L20
MRARYGKARHCAKKRLFKEARGNFGGRSKLLRTVKETLVRALRLRYPRPPRTQTRIPVPLDYPNYGRRSPRGLSYSAFMHGLAVANIQLNRKQLSELAIQNPEVFNEIVEASRKALAPAA